MAFRLAKVTFFVIFSICFASQVLDQIKKYVEGRITTTTYPQKMATAVLPAFSFCPGFRRNAFPPNVTHLQPGLDYNFFDFYPQNNLSDESIRAFWSNVSYTFEQMFIFSAFVDSNADPISHLSLESTEIGVIHQHFFWWGRCFTIEPRMEVSKHEYLGFMLNKSDMEHLVVYIHPHRAQMGLNYQHWPTTVDSFILGTQFYYTEVHLERSATKYSPTEDSPCLPDAEEFNQFDCIKEWGQTEYLDASKLSSIEGCADAKVCWFYAASFYIDELNLTACLTSSQEECMRKHFRLNIMRKQANFSVTGCLPNCTDERWQFATTGEVLPYQTEEYKKISSQSMMVFIKYMDTSLYIKVDILN